MMPLFNIYIRMTASTIMNVCTLIRNDNYSHHQLNSTLCQEAAYSGPVLPAVTNAFTINYNHKRRNNPRDLGYFNLISVSQASLDNIKSR